MDSQVSDPSLDRVVHAYSMDGGEVVRYDRAGKWYIEYPNHPNVPRRHVSVAQAVKYAVQLAEVTFLDQYGGAVFSRLYRKAMGE